MKFYESKQKLYNEILEGTKLLADNVGTTLGPRGKTVALYNNDDPHSAPVITKDGVTVAKFINVSQPFQNLGIQILKQASDKTNKEAGDGTTTSTVIAYAILKYAQKYIVADVSPVELKRGIDKVCEKLLPKLDEKSRKIETESDIKSIATISANGDEKIGSIICEALLAAGKHGSVIIKDSNKDETELVLQEGFSISSGWDKSCQFVRDLETNSTKFKNPLIYVTDETLDSVEQIIMILEFAARNKKPLILVAKEVCDEALAALTKNVINGSLKVVPINAPRYLENWVDVYEDLCTYLGATFISSKYGRDASTFEPKDFGSCEVINVSKFSTTFIKGCGDNEAVESRIQSIKSDMKETEEMRELELLQERISRLSSCVATIRVGAATQTEREEIKFRVQDALESIKNSINSGLLPGGGTALVKCFAELKKDEMGFSNYEQSLAFDIVEKAIEEPILKMASNGNFNEQQLLFMLKNSENFETGIDMMSGQLVNMEEMKIIEPAHIVKSAFKNAISAASTILTVDYAIVNKT